MVKYAVTAEQSQRIDRYTIESMGIPSLVLMERAALSIIEEILKNDLINSRNLEKIRVLAVCGNGNNGADGVAAARILCAKGIDAHVLVSGITEKYSEQMKKQLEIAESFGVKVSEYGTVDSFGEYDVIIDALFGTGLSRELNEKAIGLVNRINTSDAFVVSADVPSGVNATNGKICGEAVRADVTVTFGFNKTGLMLYPAADYAGKIVVADIGFSQDAPQRIQDGSECDYIYYEEDELKRLLPKRNNSSNKGNYGRVLIMGGFHGMSGAVLMASEAAYRTGTGLVKVCTVGETENVIRLKLPEVMLVKSEKEAVFEAVKWSTVVAAGVGMGNSAESEKLLDAVFEACSKYDRPLILDADGINILSKKADENGKQSITERLDYYETFLPKRVIFTPHIKEASRLIGVPVGEIKGNVIDILSKCAYNNYVYVFKDARTLVAHKNSRYINISGNNGMSTGGSGDVLTGIMSGILATTENRMDDNGYREYYAATTAVFLHGVAGDRAASKYGVRSMLAGDIVELLKEI